MPRWEARDYSDLPMPSEVDRAWAAGFWDGEGSTSPYGRARADGRKPGIKMYVSQARNESELIYRFHTIIGVGSVKERTDRSGVWVWVCTDARGCDRAIEILWPYLGSPKKTQIERVRDYREPARK